MSLFLIKWLKIAKDNRKKIQFSLYRAIIHNQVDLNQHFGVKNQIKTESSITPQLFKMLRHVWNWKVSFEPF